MAVIRTILIVVHGMLRDRADLAAENLVLRQQLAILSGQKRRPRLRKRGRIFRVWLSQIRTRWSSCLLIVQPDTAVRWHRQGFELCWRWKSRSGEVGRPRIEAEIRNLIRRMYRENPLWGTPRIRSELRRLGYDVSKAAVGNCKVCHHKPPSQTWRVFPDNHVQDIVAIDFFTVPAATFRILFCFVVLRHHRRLVVHFNVTAHPTARWTDQQVVEAFPHDEAPRLLIRDRDGIYGVDFRQRIKQMCIEEVVRAPRSRWQNPCCERLVGSIRRECIDHVIVLNERHLMRILRSCFAYDHEDRAHLSLDCSSPVPLDIELPDRGKVITIPQGHWRGAAGITELVPVPYRSHREVTMVPHRVSVRDNHA